MERTLTAVGVLFTVLMVAVLLAIMVGPLVLLCIFLANHFDWHDPLNQFGLLLTTGILSLAWLLSSCEKKE